MRRTTRWARAVTAAVIACGPALAGAAIASAAPDATVVPFSQILRRCDFSDIRWVGGSGYGRPTGQVRTDGGNVVADVQFATGVPNSRYDVRLIQLPRSSAVSCNPGDPGVAGAALFTDPTGAATVSLRGPIMPGATGAWVFITRPSPYSQVPKEFYTSGFIAAM